MSKNELRNHLRRFWQMARRVAGYIPLTWAGFFLLGGLLGAVFYRGYRQLDMVALAAGGSLLVVMMLSIVSVVAGFFWCRHALQHTVQPRHFDLVSGRRVGTGFSLPCWFYLPLVHLSWQVRDFGADTKLERREGSLKEFLTCHRRGLRESLMRRFEVRDTLGLASISWKLRTPATVRVLPDPGRLEQPNILLSLVSGEDISDPRGDPTGDRVDMRQYQHGDPMKFILWKVYSRSGKVMVRVPERALAARPRACCYLLAGPQDEASAAIARVLVEFRLLGEGWRFGADGRGGHTGNEEEALTRIAESGNVGRRNPRGLRSFLSEAEKDGFGFCLILAPPGNRKFASEVSDCLDCSQMQGEIWIGLDVKEEPELGWSRLLKKLESPGVDPPQVHANWNGRATLVERASGRVMARNSR